jgi:putative heme iron utilization protein
MKLQARGVRVTDPFPAEVVAQIARHMNDDHAEDNVLIVRALGGMPSATAARMSGMDADGMEFAAVVDGIEVPVRIPFGKRLVERAQVRTETVRMYRAACAALGLEPRH